MAIVFPSLFDVLARSSRVQGLVCGDIFQPLLCGDEG